MEDIIVNALIKFAPGMSVGLLVYAVMKKQILSLYERIKELETSETQRYKDLYKEVLKLRGNAAYTRKELEQVGLSELSEVPEASDTPSMMNLKIDFNEIMEIAMKQKLSEQGLGGRGKKT